jgi:hypothetical protein
VKEVRESLAMNHLVISPQKYIWGENEVEFLGYILTPQELGMAQSKTKAIQELQIPKSLRDLQLFLGFANFSRCSILASPILWYLLTESRNGDEMD